MTVTHYPLPTNTTDIEFVELCNIEGTVRIGMKIKGILFERLHRLGARKLPPVWQDPTHHFDGPMILDNDKAKDLEAIFTNYCQSLHFNLEESISDKRIEGPR